MTHTLSSIVAALGGTLEGADVSIERLSPIETATEGSLAFVSHARFARQVETTRASALILPPELAAKAGQYSAAISAEVARGKAAGLVVSKTELTGADGGPIKGLNVTFVDSATK